jgi:hypothetical protein
MVLLGGSFLTYFIINYLKFLIWFYLSFSWSESWESESHILASLHIKSLGLSNNCQLVLRFDTPNLTWYQSRSFRSRVFPNGHTCSTSPNIINLAPPHVRGTGGVLGIEVSHRTFKTLYLYILNLGASLPITNWFWG